MVRVGEVVQLRAPGGLLGRLHVLLAIAHGRELWEDLETGRQVWIAPAERAERTVGE